MRRHELSEAEWLILAPLLENRLDLGGRPPKIDDRTFLNAVLWKVRTGVPWRDIPERYGAWKTIYSRFRRWTQAGHFEVIFQALHIDVDEEWNAIDGTAIRAHQHSSGGKGGQKKMTLEYLVEVAPQKSMPE